MQNRFNPDHKVPLYQWEARNYGVVDIDGVVGTSIDDCYTLRVDINQVVPIKATWRDPASWWNGIHPSEAN